ncbi:MAG: hypothetical protein WCS28_10870 [Thiomicrospira sp.]|jgi:hypothetical protein
MEVKVKTLANGSYLIEVGHVLLSYPNAVLEELVALMDHRLTKLAPEDKAALEKSLEAHRSIALKIVMLEPATIQQLLLDLTPIQRVILCRIDPTGAVERKVMANLPKIKQAELKEDFERFEKITVKKALIQMERIIPMLKQAISYRKKIQAEGR